MLQSKPPLRTPVRPKTKKPLSPHLVRRYLLALSFAGCLAIAVPPQVHSQSNVLDPVRPKNSPLAKSMCDQFRKLNAQGISAKSQASISSLASSQGLSYIDADVRTTYVIAIHCSTVF